MAYYFKYAHPTKKTIKRAVEHATGLKGSSQDSGTGEICSSNAGALE